MNAILGLIILVADIFAILDCLKSNKSTGGKALWIILVLVLPLVGLILYYFIGRKQ